MSSVAQLGNFLRVFNKSNSAQGLASCKARGEGPSIPPLHLCVCVCACVERVRGPSELIGSEGDKGGLLQKRNPGEMFTQEKRRRRGEQGVWEVEKGRVEGLSNFELISYDVPILSCNEDGGYWFPRFICAALTDHFGEACRTSSCGRQH